MPVYRRRRRRQPPTRRAESRGTADAGGQASARPPPGSRSGIRAPPWAGLETLSELETASYAFEVQTAQVRSEPGKLMSRPQSWTMRPLAPLELALKAECAGAAGGMPQCAAVSQRGPGLTSQPHELSETQTHWQLAACARDSDARRWGTAHASASARTGGRASWHAPRLMKRAI